jgi:GNAT superfamily N-acetyltransferase
MAPRSPDERLTFRRADTPDVAAVLELRTATARDLTRRFGRGHWSIEGSARGVLNDLRISQVWLALRGRAAVATFRLSTRKPWAIDASYFTRSTRPVYLTDMAVRPEVQRQGIGRQCVEELVTIARRWPADSIRLDAYDAPAGAGEFYARCGFREVGRVSYRGNPLVYFEMMLERATGNVAVAR